ncbi:sensor histidine kinase [Halalkalibacter urbisdiaboli]|uniref:sensor histidine kinase n=1 Tax=Halalkalibacter urbisdiaboli TaxID=1960589 RepID=UPI000B44CAB9|nr:histidine kinase [Halalkalibacter urbisdiaboli]
MLTRVIRYYKSLTLRKRIVYLFSLAAFLPFGCTVILSHNALSSILENKLEESVRSTLNQLELSLMYTIDNLGQVSQQFVYPSSIALKLDEFLVSDDLSLTTPLEEEVQNQLVYISHTNSSAGLTTYIDEDGSTLFRNLPIRDDFSLEKLPVLDANKDITYYGPHISKNNLQTHYVVSVARKANLPNQKPVYIYIETSFYFTKSIIEANQMANNSFYLILDENNQITFSELNSLFPVNKQFDGAVKGTTSGLMHGYYWFMKTNKQGWSIVSLIPKKEYEEEKSRWVAQIIVLAIFFGAFSFFIAWLVWIMVYKPIRHFDSEITAISKNDLHIKSASTNIPEFDELLNQLQNMKIQISELISEVETKEKNRADLEIEKLMYQINPHFLMNTLDNVRWLAVFNNQDEIERMVSSLNKLLYYNLKRSGKASTIEEELDSLKQYFILQKIRYNFSYNVNIRIEPELLKTPIPRFILQPLVENAIYHGLDDDKGCIEVIVEQVNGRIIISISDNGSGLSDEERVNILNENSTKEKEGIGIGLSYVKRMLSSYYGHLAHFDILSKKDHGTTIVLHLPLKNS